MPVAEDEEGIEWKFNEFTKIGRQIHLLKGHARTTQARTGLKLSGVLCKSKYVLDTKVRFELYMNHLRNIADVVDQAAELESATITYFYGRHCKAGLDESLFNVTFSPKTIGRHIGCICNVNDGTQTTRYFAKVHQNGPSDGDFLSTDPPDLKEIFIYKLLHQIGMGPEPHFIVPFNGSPKTLYIATKECHFVMLSDLTIETANTKALLQINLISRILRLFDFKGNNPTNYGQVGDKPMIVDCRIKRESCGYLNLRIFDDFCGGNGDRMYNSLLAAAFKTPEEEKEKIVKESLEEWKLTEKIDKLVSEVNEFAPKFSDLTWFPNDLERYAQHVKANIEALFENISV